jgi:plastocyanin
MKISKDAKAMTVITTTGAAALLFVLATNSNAGQGYNYRSQSHSYSYGYQQPAATPGYSYGAPARQVPYSGHSQYRSVPASSEQPQGVLASAQADVKIAGMQFKPAVLKVKTGEEVIWINTGNMPHTVTGSNDNRLASLRMDNGSMFKHTFNEPGTYTYYCALHPSMTGKIIVE